MSKKTRLIDSSWLQASLVLLAALVLLFLRSRQKQPGAEQPAIWRRDIEMGPGEAEPEEELPAQTLRANAPAEMPTTAGRAPEMRAGESEIAREEPAAAVEPAAEESAAPAAEEATPSGDDLEIIEGIGPKINAILQAAGVKTFAQLAETPVERLEEILRQAGLRRISNPATWPEQAALAAAAEWAKLETLQGKLKGGRKAG